MIGAPLHRDHAAERHREERPLTGVLLAQREPARPDVLGDLAHGGRTLTRVLGAGTGQVEAVHAQVGVLLLEQRRETSPVALFT